MFFSKKGVINEEEFYERCVEDSKKIENKLKEKTNGTEN